MDDYPPDDPDGLEAEYTPTGETIEERRLRLVEEHDLITDTGSWGEIIEADLEHASKAVEVRNPEPTRSDVQLSRAEQQLAAVRMKSSGASYRHIAEVLGYKTPTAARNLVKQAMDDSLQEATDELRKIHYHRLEVMLGVHWDRMLGGDPMAFDKVGHTMDRIERLYGLSAPNRTEHTHVSREAIVIAEGDTETYLRALQEAARQRDAVDGEIIEEEPAST